MKNVFYVSSLLSAIICSSTLANESNQDNEFLLGKWEGTSSITSGFGFLVDQAILEVLQVEDARFSGTLTAIAPNNEHEPVVTPLAGVLLPDGRIHASAGTGGVLLVELRHGPNGESMIVGSSMSTVPPNDEFPFLPIASILELVKNEKTGVPSDRRKRHRDHHDRKMKYGHKW